VTLREIKKKLADHRQEITALGVGHLALFGSVVRGEAGPESDVDVLVEFEGKATFDRYMDLKFLLEDLLGRKVDLVTTKALRPELRPSIQRQVVYVA